MIWWLGAPRLQRVSTLVSEKPAVMNSWMSCSEASRGDPKPRFQLEAASCSTSTSRARPQQMLSLGLELLSELPLGRFDFLTFHHGAQGGLRMLPPEWC